VYGVTEVRRQSLPFTVPNSELIESGTHLLQGEQRGFEKPAHKMCFEPETFSTSDERSNRSATVPLIHYIYESTALICIQVWHQAMELELKQRFRHHWMREAGNGPV